MEKETVVLPERWGLFQRWKNTFYYYFIRITTSFFAFIPMCITVHVGQFLGRVGYYLHRRYRKRAHKHLHEALGTEYSSKEIRAIAKKMFKHLGRSAGEDLNAQHIIKNLSRYVEFEGDSKEKYISAIESGKGVIFCSAHIGSWELFSKILSYIAGSIWIVARKTFDPRVTRFVHRDRSTSGVRPLWRGNRPLIEAIADVLQRGDVMGFMIDQDIKVRGVFVPFFGKLAHTPSSPAQFALDFDAVIVLGIMQRRGKRHYIKFDTIDIPSNIPKDQAVYRITADMTNRLEKAIRSVPEQWVWMHRRWRQQPDHE